MTCSPHKVSKLCEPWVRGEEVIREAICTECGQTIEVVYAFAGAFIGNTEVAYEEVK
jgi:hypothetical protein